MGPHSQLEDKASTHLCIDGQKGLTPERKRLTLTKDALDKPTPKNTVLTLCMKAWNADIFLGNFSMFHFVFAFRDARLPISDKLSNHFRAAGINGCLDLHRCNLAYSVNIILLFRILTIFLRAAKQLPSRILNIQFGLKSHQMGIQVKI